MHYVEKAWLRVQCKFLLSHVHDGIDKRLYQMGCPVVLGEIFGYVVGWIPECLLSTVGTYHKSCAAQCTAQGICSGYSEKG